MALFLSSFVSSLIKAVIFGVLAFIGIKLGKMARDLKDKKK
jgi:hypothetical protein